MKPLYALSVLSIILLLSGCPLPPKVNYDFDPNFDFSSLKSYRWFELAGDVDASELIVQRIKRAIDRQLKGKGFALESESPDFLVSLRGVREVVSHGTDVTVGPRSYPGWQGYHAGRGYQSRYRYPSGEYSSFNTVKYEAGTLTLTITDAAGQPVWEGIATGIIRPELSPEEREKRINEIIADLLAGFPPIKE